MKMGRGTGAPGVKEFFGVRGEVFNSSQKLLDPSPDQKHQDQDDKTRCNF
jgi:hypothetical protein